MEACLPLSSPTSHTACAYMFKCSLLAPLRRVRYDLGKEITVLLCALVVAATFAYVFHDFLNHAVAAISSNMRDSFAHAAALLGSAIVAFRLGKFLCHASHDRYCQLQRQLGAEPSQLHLFLLLRGTWALLLSVASIVLLCHLLLRVPSFVYPLSISPPALLLGTYLARRTRPVPQRQPRQHTLFSWRWQQIWQGERVLLACAAGAALSCLPLSYLNAPLQVFGCVALICGLLASFSLASQAARDAQFAWAERNFGISHAQYVSTCEKIGASLALCCALCCAGSFIGGQLLFAPSTLALLPALLKVVLLAMLAPLLMPLLLFQIDVRRPAVQFITATLCALFIGTAILASWFSVLLYPLLRWYALQYSDGRFYRA